MASLAAAGGPSPPAPEPPHPEAAKRLYGPVRSAVALARVLSMVVHVIVMTVRLALFLLFAFVAGVPIMAIVFAARAFRRHGHGHGAPDRPDPPPRPVGLASTQISRLASFKSSQCDPKPPTCAICFEASRAGEQWRALPPCGHSFHAACVDGWLLLSPACPVCRTTVDVPTISECLSGDGVDAPPLPLYLQDVGSQRPLGM